jgi:hypothetical protein
MILTIKAGKTAVNTKIVLYKKIISCSFKHKPIMTRKEDFTNISLKDISKGESILGGAILDGEALGCSVKNTIKNIKPPWFDVDYRNRKTKPFKYFLNNYLLWNSVLMDIKGDFSGIAKEGEENLYNGAPC